MLGLCNEGGERSGDMRISRKIRIYVVAVKICVGVGKGLVSRGERRE